MLVESFSVVIARKLGVLIGILSMTQCEVIRRYEFDLTMASEL